MSNVSAAQLARAVKEALGAETNAEALEQVADLAQEREPAPVVVVIAWTPGQAQATVTVPAPGQATLADVGAALRAGLAAVEAQALAGAARAAGELERARAQLAQMQEGGEG